MSDETTPNGADAGDNQPQIHVNAQYIKDLSFENPHAPRVYLTQSGQPEIKVNVGVSANKVEKDLYEVVLDVNANARKEDTQLFIAELKYGALVTVRNVEAEQLQPYLMIEVPRIMFPFARNIIADMTRDGSYPPLMLNNIDFVELYRQSIESARQKQQAS